MPSDSSILGIALWGLAASKCEDKGLSLRCEIQWRVRQLQAALAVYIGDEVIRAIEGLYT